MPYYFFLFCSPVFGSISSCVYPRLFSGCNRLFYVGKLQFLTAIDGAVGDSQCDLGIKVASVIELNEQAVVVGTRKRFNVLVTVLEIVRIIHKTNRTEVQYTIQRALYPDKLDIPETRYEVELDLACFDQCREVWQYW